MGSPATDEDVRRWSHGRVRSPELFDGRGAPVLGGLECAQIFGPIRDHECSCGRYRGERFRAQVCVTCGVEVIESSARRYRMGHIELPRPAPSPHGGAPLTVVPVLAPGLRPSAAERVHDLTRMYRRLFEPIDDAGLADHLKAIVEAVRSVHLDRVERDLNAWSTGGELPFTTMTRRIKQSLDRAQLWVPVEDDEIW